MAGTLGRAQPARDVPPHRIADNCHTIVAVSITGIDRLMSQKTYTQCMIRSSSAGNAAKRTQRTKDGAGSARPSNGQPTRPRGRPFEPGNQLAKRRRKPMSEDELRRVLRSSMTKRGMRSLVKRLEQIIREGAGVYVLGSGGYKLARESRNGFHCIIGRSQPEAYEPQCFDAAGSATLLRQTILRGKLQMQGVSLEEIENTISEAWESGHLTAPQSPGINYMLSEKNKVPVGPEWAAVFAAGLRRATQSGSAPWTGKLHFCVGRRSAGIEALLSQVLKNPTKFQ